MEGWHSFNIERKAVAAGIFGIVANVSSTYLLYNPGNLLSRSNRSSVEHYRKTFAKTDPRGESMATRLLRELAHTVCRRISHFTVVA